MEFLSGGLALRVQVRAVLALAKVLALVLELVRLAMGAGLRLRLDLRQRLRQSECNLLVSLWSILLLLRRYRLFLNRLLLQRFQFLVLSNWAVNPTLFCDRVASRSDT